MLSKLLKYEIYATARIFLPLYVVLLVYSLIHKVLFTIFPQGWETPQIISFVIYVMILVGIFAVTLVVMIQRFYKNLFSDEGYLMFTLPTTPWKHIVSKLLVSMMWTAVSGIIAIFSILIIAFNEIFTSETTQALQEGIKYFLNYFGSSAVLYAMEFALSVVIGLAASVLIIYASIAIGHLFNRHRVLASLGAFIVLNTVSQIVGTLASAGVFYFPGHYSPIGDINNIKPFIQLFAWYSIGLSVLLSAGYFIVTNYIMSRHLNLE